MRGDLLWEPPDPESTQMARYMRAQGHSDYHELWRWSVEDVEGFWASLWDWFELGERPGGVLGRREMPGAEWFPGASVNYAEQVLRSGRPGDVAIVAGNERGDLRELTWAELEDQVGRCAAGLRRLGVGRGDRVAAYLPNIPEAVIALLATASIGAVWSSCAPEFGTTAVVDRFSQLEPKLLIAAESYRYGGRDHDRREEVEAIRSAVQSIEATVLLSRDWAELTGEPAALRFERVPFEHPLWVLFSSGTTGLPKGLVQSHGGIVLEHLKKLALHTDLSRDDAFFWFTTTGWMMWNYLVGGLLTGSAIVLYDGRPDLQGMWEFARDAGITVFGTSPAFITACMKSGAAPGAQPQLRALGSAGAPLSAEAFEWVYARLPEIWLFSTSGGTDLCTSFVSGVPTLPVYSGEIQARSLGAAVAAWSPDGWPLVGEVGELVITEPMPSMPISLLNDPDGERYRASYFEMFPGIWRHGDWIEISERGTAVISGRSDSTINRSGVRIGTAEIYRVVEAIPAVADSLVVDVDNKILLFVVADLDEELTAEIRARLAAECSPRHVPDRIERVADVPRTLSGKKLEVPVKRILEGADPETVASRGSLANPAALDHFSEVPRASG
jgi:acetoacetyl-CoA synthetase